MIKAARLWGAVSLLWVGWEAQAGDPPNFAGLSGVTGVSGVTKLAGADSSRLNQLPSLVTGSPSREIYLDCSSGNDSQNGLSAGAAVKTLSKAATLLAQSGDRLNLKRGTVCRGVLSFTKSTGTYFIDAYDDPNNPQAYLPVISGADPLEVTWEQDSAPAVNGKPVTELQGKPIYRVPLPSASFPYVRGLVLGGSLAPISNSVDSCNQATADPLYTSVATGSGGVLDTFGLQPLDPVFRYGHIPGSEIFLREGAWLWKKFRLASVDAQASKVQIAYSGGNDILFTGSTTNFNGYRITNSLPHMDCPGEWSLNEQKLYFHKESSAAAPGSPGRPSEIITRAYGIDVTVNAGAQLSIRNLRVKNTGESAVKLRGTGDFALSKVYATDNNGFGIDVYGATNVSVHSSNVSRNNRTGIKAQSILGKVYLEGNSIQSSGRLDHQPGKSVGNAALFDSMDGAALNAELEIKAHNNLIEASGYAGLDVSARKASTSVDLKFNTVKSSCLLANDCGAIYFNGYAQNEFLGSDDGPGGLGGLGPQDEVNVAAECAAAQKPSKLYIEQNFVNYSSGYTKGLSSNSLKRLGGGIYLDWAGKDAYVAYNVLEKINHERGAIHLHGGRNIRVHANKVDQTQSVYPAVSVAQLWNSDHRVIMTCYNSVTNNELITNSTTWELILKRRNNYGGSTNFADLASFLYNVIVKPVGLFTVREYEFNNGERIVSRHNNP